jgi:RND family efflux transporter MFP subunit
VGGTVAVVAAGLVTLVGRTLHSSATSSPPNETDSQAASIEPAIRVETVPAVKGGLAHVSSEPGSAHSFESADLYAKVSGYVDKLYVDIGSRVKRGDLLAEIDVPELTKDVESAAAAYQQSLAEVAQAEARIDSAIADQKAAEAKVTQSKADVDRWKAEVAYSESQYGRNRELLDLKAMPERVVEEKQRQVQSAQASYRAAESAVSAAEQQAAAATARISLARADLRVFEAKAKVAESQLERAKVMASYVKITSPYDGVITARNFHRGDFVRAPGQGGQAALLSVDRTDKMRVVVKIPDLEVPYVQPGDKATVHFSALSEREFAGAVARIADAEDPLTRTMQVEIDLPNPDGAIRDRMYGQVEIALEEAPPGVTIPSTCLVGDLVKGRGKVFVAENSQARLRDVVVGKDNGIEIEVLSGLKPEEAVILHPPGDLADGAKITNARATASRAITGSSH